MDKLEKMPPSTSYRVEASLPSQTFRARISSLFHKKETFEKTFSNKLDTIISLSVEVYATSEKYKFIKASLARNVLQTSDKDAYTERTGKKFIKRFETIYNRKEKAMDKLLHMIKTQEDLNTSFEMVDNRFASTEDPIKQLGISKIKEILHKTFTLPDSNTPSSSIKKLARLDKFVTTLPAILEEEGSINPL